MHPVRWFVWIAAASAATLLTRNPFYLIILFAIALILVDVLQRVSFGGERDGGTLENALPFSPLQFALFTIPAGALLNGLTSHFGETVIVRLPASIPYLGGAITAEAVTFGAVNGLMLATLFATFAVLNLAVPVRDLIGYLPRAFYPVAIVSAIAVTLVPGTLRQFRQVREAQAVRGHRMHGLRDWLPLFMPVLVGGLERALQMSESMTARGFAGTPQGANSAAQRLSILGLTLVLVGGVLRLIPGWVVGSPFLLLTGAALVCVSIWRAGRDVHHTRYHRPQWAWADSVAAASAVVGLLALFLWPASRDYNSYPVLSWPTFDVKVGMALLGLALPMLWAPGAEDVDDRV